MTMHARRSSEEGFVIVAVLWIIAALATLVTIYSIFVSNTAVALTGATDRVQTEAAFRAATELTSYRILSGNMPVGFEASSDMRIGSANVTVTAVSEAARIDLNFGSRDMLAGLIRGFGEDPARAAAYATRIAAWRSRVTPGEMDDEANLYRTAGLNYLPRRAPFVHADELWLVYGLPPFVVARMLPYVTVYHGRAGINLAEASPQVIAALPGMSPGKLQSVIAMRAAGGIGAGELIGAAAVGSDSVTVERARTFRIRATISLRSGHRVGSEAVVLLRDDMDEPYRVLTVRHDLDDEVSGFQPGGWSR